MDERLRKMAEQAGCDFESAAPCPVLAGESRIEAFARLVAEDCATVAEDIFDLGLEGAHRGEQAIRTAHAIRARYATP